MLVEGFLEMMAVLRSVLLETLGSKRRVFGSSGVKRAEIELMDCCTDTEGFSFSSEDEFSRGSKNFLFFGDLTTVSSRPSACARFSTGSSDSSIGIPSI